MSLFFQCAQKCHSKSPQDAANPILFGSEFALLLLMKKKHVTTIAIVLLCSILGYQLIDLIIYIQSPKPISYDTKIEQPKIIFEEESTPTDAKETIDEKDNSIKTKPVEKNKFLKVNSITEHEFQYSKDDYEGQIKKPKASGMIAVESNWEKKVLESETLIEKSLKQAASQKISAQGLPDVKFSNKPQDMERFALKIELPQTNEGAKFKLQYREPPDFGKKDFIEPVLPKTTAKDTTFSIEKTKATDSPWDNFSGNKTFP